MVTDAGGGLIQRGLSCRANEILFVEHLFVQEEMVDEKIFAAHACIHLAGGLFSNNRAAPESAPELAPADTGGLGDKVVEPMTTSLPATMTPIPPTQNAIPATTDAQQPTLLPGRSTSEALPEGVLFREDFNNQLQDGWQWWNEDPELWSFVEFGDSTWLRIVADDPVAPQDQVNSLVRLLPEGDFVITAHIIANPNENFHQANIFIFEDEASYIRLNLGFCDRCGLPDGYGYFLENITERNVMNTPSGEFSMIHRSAEDQDVYLRLVRQGGSVTGYFATEYGDWQRIGSYNHAFDFGLIGLGATNIPPEGGQAEGIVAMFEYFEVSVP